MAEDGLSRLTALIARGRLRDDDRPALEGIFGEGGRYHARSRVLAELRVAALSHEAGVPFAGYLPPDSPPSGAYDGMSLVWFPARGEGASLLTFVVGTRGLGPDADILGRPGHARYLQALQRYLRAQGVRSPIWVKRDPTNQSEPVPEAMRQAWAQIDGLAPDRYDAAIRRYGIDSRVIYAAAEVREGDPHARAIVAGFLTLFGEERRWQPSGAARSEVPALLTALRTAMFPKLDAAEVARLVRTRRFVILQGPPGTGKTRMALEVLRTAFAGLGETVQFHPAVSYETFIGGIAPEVEARELRFGVAPGWLVRAARAAQVRDFLLHIDEINRADLGRVLGEAIYLFEAREIARGEPRAVTLPQPLDDGSQTLALPPGLFVLGTMNSADRSIAILDLAVRRRFAFVDVWPDLDVVEATGQRTAVEAFSRLVDLFVQYATEDALPLLPGHAYFLAGSESELRDRLRYELLPLLREYLVEGRLGALESELRAYSDWLEGTLASDG